MTEQLNWPDALVMTALIVSLCAVLIFALWRIMK